MPKKLLINLFCVVFFPTISIASPPGATFCGPYTKSKPILLENASNITISDLEITNSKGVCITLNNCRNIKILKCQLGPSPDFGVALYNCTNVTISDCRIENVSTGVNAIECHGINVNHIQVKNVKGPFPMGQMVNFDKVSGVGNRVTDNVCENIMGKSYPEDIIAMYKSSGTAADPIQITNNWLRGGGPSKTGGGIMAGDSGGAYIVIKDNILVNPGQYGIGVASGTHIKVIGNRIYAKKQTFTGTGLYIWNQYPNKACALDTIADNKINWTNNEGKLDNFWNAGNCGNVAGWETNTFDTSINAAILPETIINNCMAAGVSAAASTPVKTAHFNFTGPWYITAFVLLLFLLTCPLYITLNTKWKGKTLHKP